MKPIIPQSEHQKICNLYINEHLVMKKIAELYNVHPETIKRILVQNNIKRIPSWIHRKLSCDDSYFDKINTPFKAYLLGFFFADGYNDEKRGKIKFHLAKQDIEILEFIKLQFKCSNKISENNANQRRFPSRQLTVSLSILSPKLSKRLKKLGAPQKKSMIMEFPKLKTKYILDFIAGYFDGDGAIYSQNYIEKQKKYSYNRKRYFLSICGTLNFLEGLGEILKKNKICKFKIKPIYNIFGLYISGPATIKNFYETIYASKNFRLTRKREKFKQFLIDMDSGIFCQRIP